MKREIRRRLLFIFLFVIISLLIVSNIFLFNKFRKNEAATINRILSGLTPTDIAKHAKPAPKGLLPTPTSSPKPLTFEEVNNLYGPCINLPVLYYHHIQNMDVAKAAGQQNLTVATDIFIDQMQYLKDKGYTTVATNTLTDFFDKGVYPAHGYVILTFDDGYSDFYVNVLPILRQFGFKAVLALPTGLVGNPGFLTWDEISQAASSGVEVINHTWSHASMGGSSDIVQKEITTADDQLNQRGYNSNKAFIYPYGTYNDYVIGFLQSKGYTLAFTTIPGSTLCKKHRFTLPRVRIGNTTLSAYGF